LSENGVIEIQTDRVERLACSQCDARMDVSKIPAFTIAKCPQCGAPMPVPARLSQFLLFRELGKGAMGAVYQAFDTTLARHVAIKVMSSKLGANRAFVERFFKEARALAALNHPNVVQIYSCGEEKGQPYIVMELVPGGRVDALMEESRISELRGLEIGVDVASGLKAASDIGLVHGDVKPENILFNRDGLCKVVDFGIARFAGEQSDGGGIWGTPFYIAPEAVRGQAVDQQADIYSLGATLFHILAGRPPFDAETAKEVILARLKSPAPSLTEFCPEIHPETARVVGRMLEESSVRRYPTYESLLADMRSVLERVRAESRVRPGSRKKKKQAGHPHAVTAVIVTVLALGILGVIFAGMKNARKSVSRQPAVPQVPPGTVLVKPSSAASPSPQAPAASAPAARPSSPAAASPPQAGAFELRLTTKDAGGADAYVQGGKSGGDKNFGQEDVLWLKSNDQVPIHLVRKVYLRFGLDDLAERKVRDAELKLTATPGGSNRNDLYKIKLWGLAKPSSKGDWAEIDDGSFDAWANRLTWNNAPGNDFRSPDGMSEDAVLLCVVNAHPNPPVGAAVSFSNADSVSKDALVDFISARRGSVTFMLTAEGGPSNVYGWKFASKEHAYLNPPELTVRGE